MLLIDCYAYSNRLLPVHPGEKTVFSLVTMIVCLASPSMATYLAVLLIMSGAVVIRAGVPWRPYLKLMAAPALFLFFGAATVAFSFSGQPEGCIFGFNLWGVFAGVHPRDLDTAARIFLKSLGATSCLFFLSLTTPVVEVFSTLRKAGAPALFVELVSLVYRFIFVLAETAWRMLTSQSSRLGYRNFRTGYYSLGLLVSNLFAKSYRRSQDLFTALSARCYTGELRVLETGHQLSGKNIAAIVMVELFLVALSFVIRI